MSKSAVFTRTTRGHDSHGTPQALFDELNKEFRFTLDVAADISNHKCLRYFDSMDDGLSQSWDNEIVWCNPPYSGDNIRKFLEKAKRQRENGTVSVLLLPSKTGNKWFHELCLAESEIRFIQGRLKFGDNKNSAPFDSMLVIFKPEVKS